MCFNPFCCKVSQKIMNKYPESKNSDIMESYKTILGEVTSTNKTKVKINISKYIHDKTVIIEGD